MSRFSYGLTPTKKHTTVTVVQSPWGGVVPPTENLALPTSCSVEIMQMLLLIFNY